VSILSAITPCRHKKTFLENQRPDAGWRCLVDGLTCRWVVSLNPLPLQSYSLGQMSLSRLGSTYCIPLQQLTSEILQEYSLVANSLVAFVGLARLKCLPHSRPKGSWCDKGMDDAIDLHQKLFKIFLSQERQGGGVMYTLPKPQNAPGHV
jgi:hypothetical protein